MDISFSSLYWIYSIYNNEKLIFYNCLKLRQLFFYKIMLNREKEYYY